MDTADATVLVVEDHDSVRIAITRFLRAGGFSVLDAATPDAAKAIWTEHADRISLLVVDIGLNTISGPALVAQLRNEGPVVPVIFVTATDDIQRDNALRNFPNPTVLQKPFSAEALVKAVRDALSAPSVLSGFTTFFKRQAKTVHDSPKV